MPFLPASTASSARPPQGCCTLHPIMGFGPFRVNDADHALRRFQPRLPSPEPRFTPFRAFPSPAAVPRHRGPCPRAVRRHPRTEVRGAVPTSRPCSADESGIVSRRCRRDRPVALLGFVPLQGPPRILCVPSPEGLETRPSLSFEEPGSRRATALRRPLEESGGVLPVPRRSVRFRLRRCEPRKPASDPVLARFAVLLATGRNQPTLAPRPPVLWT